MCINIVTIYFRVDTSVNILHSINIVTIYFRADMSVNIPFCPEDQIMTDMYVYIFINGCIQIYYFIITINYFFFSFFYWNWPNGLWIYWTLQVNFCHLVAFIVLLLPLLFVFMYSYLLHGKHRVKLY